MPGKHAPASSKSFLLSLATAVGGAIAALAVVVGIALVALNAGSDDETGAAPTLPSRSPATSPSPTVTSTPTATATGTAQPTGRLNSPAETTLRILNGTNRAGMARTMANRAKQEGYPEAKLGNTPRAPKSTIYYRFDGREEAEDFQRLFPEFTEIAAAPASFATDVILTIVVGEDYPSGTPTASPSA